MKHVFQILTVVVAACCFAVPVQAESSERPNILWITAEDMSPTLGCYGDDYATTPNIDRLARQSVRYTHAFASAPVCSPARSCLITGRYATSLGTQQMRSAFPIPSSMRGFPALMRQEGYYTSNNAKTDYNTANWKEIIKSSWNESSQTAHWRKRNEKDQPFFSVFNLMTSHQSRSMVWPREQFVEKVQSRLDSDEIHDPDEAPLPPYYPDTPVIRRTVARFYDCVTAMDQEVGAILEQLEEDGLAEETIVVFYSDHGSGMPRHKRALLDSGMHVPLLVRFPEKYQHLAPAEPGETVDRLVSFVDFGPTMLSLAGVDVPESMQGRPFLGAQQTSPREWVYGHRDRVDEVRDLARSVRGERYLYIRNYMPHLGYNQPTAWPDQGSIRDEFYRLADRETLTEAQWHFVAPSRPVEELYDCRNDPHNIHNLADSPEHQDILRRMRAENRRHIRETRDLGFLPESEAWKIARKTTPWEAARQGEIELETIYQAAEQVGMAEEPALLMDLGSPLAAVRYWAAIGLNTQESISAKARRELTAVLNDSSMAVRIETAAALAEHGEIDEALPVLTAALHHNDLNVLLHAARTIEMLGQKARPAVPDMRQALRRAEDIFPPETPATTVQPGREDLAMFITFAIEGFLNRVGKHHWISLFDGKTLDGWKARADGEVEAKDGEIRLLAKGSNLWVAQETNFDDFELHVEAKMPEGHYNSGIGFRCTSKRGKPKGYQCEVAGKKSGMIYAIGSGWVWPKNKQQRQEFYETAGNHFRDGAWNDFRIRCEGEHIQIWVNGVKTADVRDDRFAEGFVAIQHHGRGGVHRFRNIRIRKR